MVKVSSGDALAILRRYGKASDEHTPRMIEQLKVTNPSPTNTLAAFRFQKQHYYVLFDDTVEDDTSYALDVISGDGMHLTGAFLENPNDHLTTYALPFKGKEVYVFEVRSDKTRLDQELARRYPEQSRSTWQKYVKAGYVSVNGTVITSPKTDVTEADSIAATLPDNESHDDKRLPILYIDDDVIVIDKPVGVLTHSKGVLNDEFTAADFFRRYTTWGLDTNRPGVVHRLDRDTSGVLIGARHEQAAQYLKKQFADRTVKKSYLAIVKGVPKHHMAEIDVPIGRNPSAPSTFRADPKGKSAQTTYEVLAANKTNSLLLLKPRTGRTHQLRVHLKHLGTPIVGDRVYGREDTRMYLHAYKLEITLPTSERTTFVAPAPKAFTDIFEEASRA